MFTVESDICKVIVVVRSFYFDKIVKKFKMRCCYILRDIEREESERSISCYLDGNDVYDNFLS